MSCAILIHGQPYADHWPYPTAASIASGTFGNDKFILIGDQGTLLQSLNGTEWDTCYSPMDGFENYKILYFCYYLRNVTEILDIHHIQMVFTYDQMLMVL